MQKWSKILLALCDFKRYWPFALIFILLYLFFEVSGKGDFDIFLSASYDLFQQKDIYAIKYQTCYHYYYDLPFAIGMYPLTKLPFLSARLIWVLIQLILAIRIFRLIPHFLPISSLSSIQRQLFFLLLFVFNVRFIHDNLHLAQLTIFILWLCLEAVFRIQKGEEIKGAALLSLGISIKLLPLVFIPYLIYRSHWKALFYTIGWLLFLTFVPALFLGWTYTCDLLSSRWSLINPSQTKHILDTDERSFHSLTTLLSTLLVKDCKDLYALPIRRHIADVSLETLSLCIHITRLFFVGLTLYFLNSLPFKKSASTLQRTYEISYLCLLIPLIFPHQQHYAFLFILPSTAYLLFYLIQQKKRNSPRVMLMCTAFFLSNAALILGTFRHYYEHYKILTWAAILYIIILAMCPPRFIHESK